MKKVFVFAHAQIELLNGQSFELEEENSEFFQVKINAFDAESFIESIHMPYILAQKNSKSVSWNAGLAKVSAHDIYVFLLFSGAHDDDYGLKNMLLVHLMYRELDIPLHRSTVVNLLKASHKTIEPFKDKIEADVRNVLKTPNVLQ